MPDTFEVQGLSGKTWEVLSIHDDQREATDRARSLDRRQIHPRLRVVVNSTDSTTGAPRRLVTFEAAAGEKRERDRARKHAVEQARGQKQARIRAARKAARLRYLRDGLLAIKVFAGLAVVLFTGAALIAGLDYLR